MVFNGYNPALQDLKDLAGAWETELSHASFLPGPEATVKGKASFEWFEGGDFFILRQGIKNNETPWATWLIGRDQGSRNYTVLYIDDRQFSRVYEMSFENGKWEMWRKAPGFIQRFTGTVSKDSKTIKGHWEKSTDGKIWDHDFDLCYKKI